MIKEMKGRLIWGALLVALMVGYIIGVSVPVQADYYAVYDLDENFLFVLDRDVPQNWIEYLNTLPAVINVVDDRIYLNKSHQNYTDAVLEIKALDRGLELKQFGQVDEITGIKASFDTVTSHQYLSESPFVFMSADGEKTILCLLASNGEMASIAFASHLPGGLVSNNAGDRALCEEQTGLINDNNPCNANPNLPFC